MEIDVTNEIYPCCRVCDCPIEVARDKLEDGSIMCMIRCPIQDFCKDLREYLDKLLRKEV